MTEEREALLIEKSKQGDIAAFEELIEMHKSKLFFFALSITGGNYEEAEDILQDALANAFFGIGKIKGKLYFTSWVWKILRNALLNSNRKRRPERDIYFEEAKYLQLSSGECSEKEIINEEKYKNIRKLVSLLPMKFREVVVLVDLQEMNYEEAGKLLDISSSAVKSRVFRGREKLAGLVRKHMELFK